MGSLFKPSAETAQEPWAKILLWGPSGAGKTHWGLSAEEPVLLDLENRGRSFARRGDQFNFMHAEIATLAELGTAFKEIRAGKVPCKSIVVDSASAIYYKLVAEHTSAIEKQNGGGFSYVTDWVTVNRRFLDCLNFVFALAGKNVIFTAHAATKLVRKGNNFEAAGLKFVGDDKFRFGFDYIFRIEPKGDPAVTPAMFHVEKSTSPHLRVGQAISGLTYARFSEIVAGKAPAQQPAGPRAVEDDGSPITTEQCERIEVLQHECALGAQQIADIVKRITRRTPQYQQMTAAEAGRMIAVLQQRQRSGAA